MTEIVALNSSQEKTAASTEAVPIEPRPGDLLTYWSKAEDVAMHFNDLLASFRLRALGALAVGSGLVGAYLTKSNGPLAPDDWLVLGGALFLVAVVWGIVALVDTHYYMLLLRGAVVELLRLEAQFTFVRLSTEIENVVQKGGWPWPPQARGGERPRRLIMLMYGLPGIVLVVLSVICLYRGTHTPAAAKTIQGPTQGSMPSAPKATTRPPAAITAIPGPTPGPAPTAPKTITRPGP